MLTLKKLKAAQPHEIIAHGIATNSPEGVFMTQESLGKELMWVAVRGEIHDWTIYIHWKEKGISWILDYGDKIFSEHYIKKLVPCDNEAYEIYRF